MVEAFGRSQLLAWREKTGAVNCRVDTKLNFSFWWENRPNLVWREADKKASPQQRLLRGISVCGRGLVLPHPPCLIRCFPILTGLKEPMLYADQLLEAKRIVLILAGFEKPMLQKRNTNNKH